MTSGDEISLDFTEEEYREYFLDPSLKPKRRKLSRSVRVVGLAIAGVMLLGGVASLVREVLIKPDVREPVDIEAAAWERVGDSSLGWLVDEILVVAIDEPRIGAFVTNNPPDGVIQIDLRPWTNDRLDRLVDHEIGHLLEFAVWQRNGTDPDVGLKRGGLGQESWAECAAVDAGTRRVDATAGDDEYHCQSAELATYRAAVGAIGQVCKPWGDQECRNLDG